MTAQRDGSDLAQNTGSMRLYRWQEDWRLISCAVAVGLLLYASLEDRGEGFINVLRIYVSVLALLLAFTFWKQRQAVWGVAAVIAAIFFNPFIPIEIGEVCFDSFSCSSKYSGEGALSNLIAAAGFAWLAISGLVMAITSNSAPPAADGNTSAQDNWDESPEEVKPATSEVAAHAAPVKKLWTWGSAIWRGLLPATVIGALAWFGSLSRFEPFQSEIFFIVGIIGASLVTVPLSLLFTWLHNKNARSSNRRHGYPEDGGAKS